MKKNVLNLLVLVAMLGIVALSSCKDDDDDKGWTDAQRTEFISSCTDPNDGDGSQEQCECFANSLEKAGVNFDDFKEYSESEEEEEEETELTDLEIKILQAALTCL